MFPCPLAPPANLTPNAPPRRWKQRDIHEKRETRNQRIEELDAEISCNDILLARLRTLSGTIAEGGAPRFSAEVERLRTSPSPEAPHTNAPKPVSYDEMVLRLLEVIAKEAKDGAGDNESRLPGLLEQRLEFHVQKLGDVTSERRNELEELVQEKARHITMDDMHEGFESKVRGAYYFLHCHPTDALACS